jgi:DNA helicase II / ATP-dependent DNA helicase PcrA
MSTSPTLSREHPSVNANRRDVIDHTEGPLLVIAEPRSSKTLSLILRTLNLLLPEKAQPHEIVLCTFTEKGTIEFRDRVLASRSAQRRRR